MGSMRPNGRFLSFANNIQRTQKQPVPSGFPQSLSGSETDVSTSNENLSREERYVVRHTARVEPQGQENQSQTNNNNNNNRNTLKDNVGGSNRNSLKDSVGGGNSNRSSLDVSSSSYNTLIIHNQDDSWSSRPTPIREHERTNSEVKHSTTQSSPYHTLKKSDAVKKPSGIPLPKVHKEQTVTASANYIDIGGQRIYTSPPDQGVQEINEIPDDFLNQSSVLKHLAKEVTQSPTPRGLTPPASPHSTRAPSKPREERKGKGSKAKLSKEKLNLSRSQPDLTSVGVRAVPGGSESSGWCSGGEGSLEEADDAFAAVLDALAAENHALKRQLADACERVAKTHKLEQEVEKVRTAHEELVGSCERRERLERAARVRLQADCRRLHEINRALKHQTELLSSGGRAEGGASVEALRKELQGREMLIAQLITQNKELACAKERQEIEMSAQRATLQEQRTHIDILDTALTNAQANVVRLEDECRHASGYVERVLGLQRALASLQQASDRREHTERKLRAQLETELQALRKRECVCGGVDTSGVSGGGGGGGGGAACGGEAGAEAELRRALRSRDERLLALEGECAKWEQRYLEEAALRQAAVSAASIPKDAKIAALEKTSAESERLMAEARSEKIRHMDELHSAQKKVADLESRVKELESKVAERDAMIKVLQKHTSAASLRNNSSREELVGLSSGASFSSAEGVGSAGVTNRYRHLARRNYSPHNDNSGCGFDSSSLRLEEQLAALESRLDRPPVPARGLCCFPGLSAAGVRGRGEEALLLERQGRASQQTRSSSLPPPPSALPRPPRKPSARNTRYERMEHRDARKDSDGSGSIASTASRSSPSPYDTVRKLPSVPTSASLPAAESRESLVRPRDSSLPSPSKLAVYAAARRRSAESAKDNNKRTHHYRIQF
ncbi:angiomotin-like protein 2 [Danaus plexippus]|uniref:angiomotin-like protein 2 n=1 Tax=Danaus plexippus TaxID=13037 RepID=UPI002AB0C44A|nr:angiomotin-like protein 2 [Danaus plexippus]XP_061377420.1 angiomotin-like protein 2 [Danaus plexippus]XP_061377421.1 angiomotin-like protein 2 [Danaus plexippus]XP_061377422.1 angiomotin-like protein 2 [Danaus plexippus]